jgi:hypothetical protein
MDRIDERVLPYTRREDGLGVLCTQGLRSRLTASQISSPSAYDATAPWDPVQNGHWLTEDTNAANSSRSPTLQSDGPFIARSSVSEKGRPKSSGR